MGENDSIEDTIRTFVIEQLLECASAPDLENDTALVSGGLLDSISVVRLASYLENVYSIALSSKDLAIANFNTIDAIAEMIARKLRDSA